MVSIWNIAKSALNRVSPSNSAPYFAEYKLGRGSKIPAEFLEKINGLNFWHTIAASASETILYTYWASSDHFRASEQSIKSELSCQANPHGLISSANARNPPWWLKINPLTIIITIAALIGASKVIQDLHLQLTSPPELLIKSEPGRIDAIEGDPITAHIQVSNQINVEHNDIVLSSEINSDTTSTVSATSSPSRIPELNGHSTSQITIDIPPLKPGPSRLDISATASAGLIAAPQKFKHTISLEVWPKYPSGKIKLTNSTNGTARIAGTLNIGPAALNGLDCAIELRGVEGVSFDNYFDFSVAHKNLLWRTAGTGSTTVATLKWSTPPIQEGKKTLILNAFFSTKSNLNQDQAKAIDNASFNCQYRKEVYHND
jgi:hypothetical protein